MRPLAYALYGIAVLIAAVIVSAHFEPDSDVQLRELWWVAFVAAVATGGLASAAVRAWRRRRRARRQLYPPQRGGW